jgi:hypothetical protein
VLPSCNENGSTRIVSTGRNPPVWYGRSFLKIVHPVRSDGNRVSQLGCENLPVLGERLAHAESPDQATSGGL